MSKIGYIRVSTEHQETARQEELMKGLGVEKIFMEKQSGKDTSRPELTKMLNYARAGDELYVESISRLSRSIKDLLNIMDTLQEKEVKFISHKESLDTGTAQGRFVLSIFGALAELEREQLLQRQREGIAIAKSLGKYQGRKPIDLDDKKLNELLGLHNKSEITVSGMCAKLHISRSTLYRRIKNV